MVLPSSSKPVLRFQPPARVESVWNRKLRSRARSSRKACSATVVWLTPGVKRTGMPLAVAVFDVDLVDADAVLADDLEAGQGLLEDLGRDRVVAADVAVEIAHQRERVGLVERAAGGDDLPAGFLQQPVVVAGGVLEGGGRDQDARLRHGYIRAQGGFRAGFRQQDFWVDLPQKRRLGASPRFYVEPRPNHRSPFASLGHSGPRFSPRRSIISTVRSSLC
jgi:hypothetical protein